MLICQHRPHRQRIVLGLWVIRAELQFRDLASLAPMSLTMRAVLTNTRAFGSFCCPRVLHDKTQYQCPWLAEGSALDAGGLRARAACVANWDGGWKVLGVAACPQLARSRKQFRPIDRGLPLSRARK